MRLKKLYKQTLKNGGCTLGLKANTGFMVSLANHEKIIDLDFKLFKETIKEYKKLKKQFKNVFIGLWINNNQIFFDISQHFYLKSQAIFKGVINKQQAIYDIKNQTSIYL